MYRYSDARTAWAVYWDRLRLWGERAYFVRRLPSAEDEKAFSEEHRRYAVVAGLWAAALFGLTVTVYILVSLYYPVKAPGFGASARPLDWRMVLAIAWAPFAVLSFCPREWVIKYYEPLVLALLAFFLIRLLQDTWSLPDLLEKVRRDVAKSLPPEMDATARAWFLQQAHEAPIVGIQVRLLTLYTFLVVFFRLPYRTALGLCVFTLLPALVYLTVFVPGGVFAAINVGFVIALCLITSWMLEDRERRLFLEKKRFNGIQLLATQQLQEQVEHARRARSAQLEFIRDAFHDVKNGFWSFGNYLSALEASLGRNEEVTKKAIKGLSLQRESTYSLVMNLLDIAEVQGGRRQPDMQAVDLIDVLRQVQTMLEPNATSKGIELRLRLPLDARGQDAAILVMTDRVWLTQVLVNLVGNAIKFTGPSKAEPTAAHGKRKRVSGVLFGVYIQRPRCTAFVIDTGVGIKDEDRDAIWNYAVTERGTNDEPGTGIGLPLVRTLCQALRHEIRMESVYGTGTRFWVDLALCREEGRIKAFKQLRPHVITLPLFEA